MQHAEVCNKVRMPLCQPLAHLTRILNLELLKVKNNSLKIKCSNSRMQEMLCKSFSDRLFNYQI